MTASPRPTASQPRPDAACEPRPASSSVEDAVADAHGASPSTSTASPPIDPEEYLRALEDDRAERASWRRSEPTVPLRARRPQRPPRATWRSAPSPAAPTAEQRERGLAAIEQIRAEMAARRADHPHDPAWRAR